MGTYNPDKYILGNVTKPNKKTFVNYDKDKAINKGNNTKIPKEDEVYFKWN